MESVFAKKLLPFRQIQSYSIIHLGERTLFFNESGTRIWNLIDGQRNARAITLALAEGLTEERSEKNIERLASKVNSFLEALSRKGLLWRVADKRVDEPPSTEITTPAAATVPSPTSPKDPRAPERTIQSLQEACMTSKSIATNPDSLENKIQNLYWENNYIQKMHLELTYRCNFRCLHCYNTTHGGGASELTTDEWRHALDQLADMGCWLLTFTGGEVFVRKDALEILQHACDRAFTFRINTNGSLIDEKMIAKLEPMRPFLQSFDISFYGAIPEVHDTLAQSPGSYSKTLRALRLLLEAKMGVVPKFVTMRDNFDGIAEFEKDMRALGTRYLVGTGSLIPQTNRNTKPLAQLLTDEQYKNLMSTRSSKGFSEAGNCKPGHIRGAITPDGHVSPCEWLTDFKYGNLREKSLREIWYSAGFLSFRKRFEEPSECVPCGVRSSCGRCPAHSYLETGDLLKCAPIQLHNAVLCHEIGV